MWTDLAISDYLAVACAKCVRYSFLRTASHREIPKRVSQLE